jgi:hypothetical protein
VGPFGAIRWRKKEPVSRSSERRAERKKNTIVYKRGGHAPCLCDVTLKKDDGSVGVDNCSALRGGNDKGRRQFCKGTYFE